LHLTGAYAANVDGAGGGADAEFVVVEHEFAEPGQALLVGDDVHVGELEVGVDRSRVCQFNF